jgi:hypothetical protein
MFGLSQHISPFGCNFIALDPCSSANELQTFPLYFVEYFTTRKLIHKHGKSNSRVVASLLRVVHRQERDCNQNSFQGKKINYSDKEEDEEI